MLTAQQARQLKDSMQKQQVEVVIYNILKDIAERAIDPDGRNYIYSEVDFVDEKRVDFVVNKLSNLGYTVEATTHTEDGYTDLTVRF
jgi:hypothetical protein